MDDADLMSNLLFGFGSGSTGAFLGTGVADAAGSDSVAAAVAVSLLFFLLFSSLYFLGQRLVDHFISSIQSFCSM